MCSVAKALTIAGTRPELIRLSRLIPRLDTTFNQTFVYTNQNFESSLRDVFFEDLELRDPNYVISAEKEGFVSALSRIFIEVERIIKVEKPDFAVVLGDTNSALSAIVCERLGVPVYHLEAGNRSFDNRVPEELNRRIVDHTASFNLTYTPNAKNNLLREGLHPRSLSISGSPIREVFEHYKDRILESQILSKLGLSEGEYLVVSMHRQETVNFSSAFEKTLVGIEGIAASGGLRVVMTVHPRVSVFVRQLSEILPSFILAEPLGYLDFTRLQMSAKAVISDSGSISEESSIIGFPALTVRKSMERPEALETGAMILAGLTTENINLSLTELTENGSRVAELPSGYEVLDFSDRVIRFIMSTYHVAHEWRGISIDRPSNGERG